jgi:hypothetical protein
MRYGKNRVSGISHLPGDVQEDFCDSGIRRGLLSVTGGCVPSPGWNVSEYDPPEAWYGEAEQERWASVPRIFSWGQNVSTQTRSWRERPQRIAICGGSEQPAGLTVSEAGRTEPTQCGSNWYWMPDQSFQTLKRHFWFSVYIDGVEIVDGHVFLDFPGGFPSRITIRNSSKNSPQSSR